MVVVLWLCGYFDIEVLGVVVVDVVGCYESLWMVFLVVDGVFWQLVIEVWWVDFGCDIVDVIVWLVDWL